MRNGKLMLSALTAVLGITLYGCQPAKNPGPSPQVSRTPQSAPTSTPSPQKAQAVECPVRLTASDGTGLELVNYSAKAVVNGPLAFTELHLTFQNPADRQIEGHFEITMPDKAAISRFAMKVNNDWQEAEVVELQKARAAYEDFLHRRQDPALLEKQAGNQFQARVFPIPPKGQKELIISYSQELTAGQDFRLPLQGLPKVGNLSVRASAWQGPNKPTLDTKLDLQGQAPVEDFVVQRTSPTDGLVQGRLALLQVSPKISDSAIKPEDLLIVVDTSASRSAGYSSQIDKLEGLLGQLAVSAKDIKVKIAAFDQDVSEVYSGDLAGSTAAIKTLRERRPLGATDLEKMLAWAGKQSGFKRLVVMTDGVDTAGSDKLKEVGFDRVDVILCGGIRKAESLFDVAQTQPPKGGLVLDADKSSSRELSNSLLRHAVSGVKVEVKGAKWVWPERLDGLEPGQQRLIYAELGSEGQKAEVTLKESKGFEAQKFAIDLTSVSWPLLARAASAAQIARLTQMLKTCPDKEKTSITHDIVELSCKSRVVCDFTGLLVLETDYDYQRFGISRTALSDILIIGQQGLEVMHRAKPVVLAPKQQVSQPFRGNVEGKSGDLRSRQVVGSDDGEAVKFDAAASADKVASGGEGSGQPPVYQAPAAQSAAAPGAGRLHENASTEISTGGVARTETMDRSFSHNVRRESVRGYVAPVRDESLRSGNRLDQRTVTRNLPAPPPPPGQPRRQPPEPMATAVPAPVSNRVPSILTTPSGGQVTPTWQSAGVSQISALSGQYGEIHQLVLDKKADLALEKAQKWQQENPGELLALVALGEAYHAKDLDQEAARAFGSIIDLFPGRADLRRYAGCQLESLGKAGNALALDSYFKAVEQRPDHPSSYRLKAYALLKAERWKEAFETVEAGLKQNYPGGRFAQAQEVLGEDLMIVGRIWSLKEPSQASGISKRLSSFGLRMADQASTRFVLIWETDANDVDFHILDSHGGHAFYSNPGLSSGGRLYADVTTGYGPECFNIPGGAKSGPYRIGVHYYSRGPMGFGMGKVQVLRHDGKDGLKLEERPYVVMQDGAFVDLGSIDND